LTIPFNDRLDLSLWPGTHSETHILCFSWGCWQLRRENSSSFPDVQSCHSGWFKSGKWP